MLVVASSSRLIDVNNYTVEVFGRVLTDVRCPLNEVLDPKNFQQCINSTTFFKSINR